MATSVQEGFDAMALAMDDMGSNFMPNLKAVITFNVTDTGVWTVSLKNGTGTVAHTADGFNPDLFITLSESHLLSLFNGDLDLEDLVAIHCVTIEGDVGLAMHVKRLFICTLLYIGRAKHADKKHADKTSSLKSAKIFEQIGEVLAKDDGSLAQKVGGVIQFVITPGGAWHLDCKASPATLTEGTKQANVTITMADDELVALAAGDVVLTEELRAGNMEFTGKILPLLEMVWLFKAIKPKSTP